MILKAYIKDVPVGNENAYKVRIPFLEDNTNHEMVFKALLCTPPGEYYGYEIGDCVYVEFEDDKLNVPVILGKLYIGPEDEVSSYHVVNNLNVTGNVTLPDTTKIGDYSAIDFFKLYQGGVTNNSSGGMGDYILISTWMGPKYPLNS